MIEFHTSNENRKDKINRVTIRLNIELLFVPSGRTPVNQPLDIKINGKVHRKKAIYCFLHKRSICYP